MKRLDELEGEELDAMRAKVERALAGDEDVQPEACTACGKKTATLIQDGSVTWYCVECLGRLG